MKIFFGRINLSTTPTDQFERGFYKAKKGSTYFDEINDIEDFERESIYVFMIGGEQVELWKAVTWAEGWDGLVFAKCDVNLHGMNRHWLAACKHFKLTKDLIVFTARRPNQKAFFRLQEEAGFTEDMLLDDTTYADYQNYRKTELLDAEPLTRSYNLRFYKSGGGWKMASTEWMDSALAAQFVDNSSKTGSGQPNKDSLIQRINEQADLPQVFSVDELKLINVYDVFFCPYQISTSKDIVLKAGEYCYKASMSPDYFTEEDMEHILQQRLLIVSGTNAIGGNSMTQGEKFNGEMKVGDYFYLCYGNKRLELIGRITGDSMPCTQDGFEDSTWMQRPYEVIQLAVTDDAYSGVMKHWTPNFRSTFVPIPDHELPLANSKIFAPYFEVRLVKQQQPEPSDPKEIVIGEKPPALNTILYGPPGTGKTLQLQTTYQAWFKSNCRFITFHQKYSYEDFIAGIKPVLNNGRDGGASVLQFERTKGILYQSCESALSLAGYGSFEECYRDKNRRSRFDGIQSDQSKQYALFIDEINRANISAVFGELITLIEDDKRIGTAHELWVELPGSTEKFCIPPNLYIIGTMNTADKSIALLDIALRRRFQFLRMYPEYDKAGEHQGALLKLNSAIYKEKKSADFLIGHAFFMKDGVAQPLATRTEIYNRKIIPLLMEYFGNKTDTVQRVLAEADIPCDPPRLENNFQIIAQ